MEDEANCWRKSPLSSGGSVGYWQINELDGLIRKVPEIQRTILQVQDPFGNVIGLEAPFE